MRLFPQTLWVGIFVVTIGAPSVFAEPRPDLGWQTYTDPQGTRDDIPAGLFVVRKGPTEKGVGEEWTTADGRARL
ncbi:MAG: hypothetical protein QOI40_5006 [Alphaproteobacteria bacterium]|nr:hypothetical protein [Alphaproteobacteria bacterium]